MHAMGPIELDGGTLLLPEDFAEYFAESKGYFKGAILTHKGAKYALTFYDATRLTQDVVDELGSGGSFFEKNLIVVRRVDVPSMRQAVERLIGANRIEDLTVGA